MHKNATNPFTFGDLALDDAFTDREDEVRELTSDMRNGQNVLVYAPRRYGKSSLVLRAAQEAMQQKALVGYVDLMKTPTKERFAAALAKTIYADIASPIDQAFERAADLFRGLRVRPTMEVDPTDGSLRFSFQASRRKEDIDDTIERLLELLGELAAERKRRVVIIFDEFQEVLSLDKRFPNLMRAVFQAQPEVSSRVPGQQAAHPRAHLQRQERAVLAQRQAARDRDDSAGRVRELHPRSLRELGEGHLRRRHRPTARRDGRTPVWHAGACVLHMGARHARR